MCVALCWNRDRRPGPVFAWSEGLRGALESTLGPVLEELENRAAHDDEEVAEQRRRAEEWQRQAEEQRERELRARIEQARAARLADEVAAWRLSRGVIDYVAALRATLDDVDEPERQRLASWCDWAETFAARSDPTQNSARVRGLDDERDRFFAQSRGWP